MHKLFITIISVVLISSNLMGIVTDANEPESLKNELEQTEDKIEKVNILINLSEYYSWKDINLSEEYAKQALTLSVEKNYDWGIAYANFYLARVFIDYDYDLTEKFIINSMELAKDMNDQLLLAKLFNLVGNLKDLNNLFSEALTYYEKSMLIYQEFGNDSLIAGLYNNIAILHVGQNKDSLAVLYYLKATEINANNKNYLWLAINYLNLGDTYLRSGEYNKSLDYLNKSLDLSHEYKFTRLLPWIYNNISVYHFKHGDFNQSIEFANRGISSAREMINRAQEIDGLKHLKSAHFALNNLNKAYELSELILEKSDSLQTNNRLKEIDMLNLIYEHNKEMELNKLVYTNQRKIYWYIIVSLVLTIGLGLSLVYNQKVKIKRDHAIRKNLELEKKVLQQEAEVKSREITKEILHLSEMNELINDIIKKLSDPSNHFVPENEKLINEIVANLKLHKNNNVWEAFDQEFTQVHPRFFKKLSHYFPKLTQNDKRLCAFLRLNMNTKDISEISNIGVSSVEKARTRLRNKLKLTGIQTCLTAFLQEF